MRAKVFLAWCIAAVPQALNDTTRLIIGEGAQKCERIFPKESREVIWAAW
jgi:hypothetical protein